MSPLRPHFNKFFNARSDGLWGVLDVGVPDLYGSSSGHLKLIILDNIYSHQSSIVCICFIIGPGIVHVTLDDIQYLSN